MRALFIVDMQKCFVKKDGELPVPNAESIINNIRTLITRSPMYDWMILGSVDRHFEDDVELGKFPPHGMDGTDGQKLITEIFLKNTYPVIHFVPNKVGKYGKYEQIQHGNLIEMIKNAQENSDLIFFEKQTTNVFTNPHIDFVIEKTGITEVVVVGIATDYCVKDAVLGFLERGISVKVVSDAITGIDPSNSMSAVHLMKEKGAKFATLRELIAYENDRL